MPFHSIFKRGCLAIAIAGLLGISSPALSASAPAKEPAVTKEEKKAVQILFTNVNIFDGFSPELKKGMSVLIENNYIKEVGKDINTPEGAFVVDGKGRTMTPGLIDMHQHVMLNPPEGTAAYQTRWDEAAGGAYAQHHLVNNILLKGITTVRDIAG
ncbi:MAG: hypothetical protein QNL05_01100, partial [Gammaproteobacteria bacterium]|nr:hypothetical protein [Gammaproteobacteria bacterium]MDX2486130.1 hypothetical protein [Gammaproteobacteria bacterium]